MSKTLAGMVLIAGMGVVFVCGSVAAKAGDKVPHPSQDWIYDLVGWVGIGGAVVGLAMFFAGAMVFARK